MDDKVVNSKIFVDPNRAKTLFCSTMFSAALLSKVADMEALDLYLVDFWLNAVGDALIITFFLFITYFIFMIYVSQKLISKKFIEPFLLVEFDEKPKKPEDNIDDSTTE